MCGYLLGIGNLGNVDLGEGGSIWGDVWLIGRMCARK